MNFLNWLFGAACKPASPPPPAAAQTFEAVRGKASEAVAALRVRLDEAARKRRDEAEKGRSDAGSRQGKGTSAEAPVERRSSLRRQPRYSISSVRNSLECAMAGLDPRAFARRIMEEVRTVYGGNPVPFYTAAELSRSAYSKLISHPDRHPSKDTVLAMAAAFKMDLPEAEAFLRLAGYSLSEWIPADLVWRACFAGGVHHLPQIRQLLSEFAAG